MNPWPHSPIHRLGHPGAYIVTAATHQNMPFFSGNENLSSLNQALFELAEKYEWQLQVWAVFPNQYHFVAVSPDDAESSAAWFEQHAEPAFRRQVGITKTDRVNVIDNFSVSVADVA